MDKVLVLGGSGLIGKAIINEISKGNKYDIYATYFKNEAPLSEDRSYRLNAEDTDNIKHILDDIKPQSVISCLRGDFGKLLILHAEIAQYLKETGGRLYFCSTTNVFDNDLSRPHYEDDTPDSQTDYGKYKIECEKRIRQILQEDACILRLPQVWGKDSPRMKQLIKSLKNNEKVEVYPRLFYNTTTAGMIARKTAFILERNLKGIFHLASEDTINYKEFYSELAKKLGFSNPEFEENYEEEGQFALLSKRSNEFPEELRVTNKWVINYLADMRFKALFEAADNLYYEKEYEEAAEAYNKFLKYCDEQENSTDEEKSWIDAYKELSGRRLRFIEEHEGRDVK